jgi:hypothetical protein
MDKLTDLNAAETKLLAGLQADPMGCHDLEGVRGPVLLSILGHMGISVTPAWRRMAASLGGVLPVAPKRYGVDYEALILDRQGREYGENDVY